MPETSYDRTLNAIDIDTWTDAEGANKALEKKLAVEGGEEKSNATTTQTQAIDVEPKKTYLRELLPWDGYWGKDSFITTFLSPFYVAASPVVLWGTLLFTTCISWLVLIGITLSQIFSGPPYNFSVSSVGATNVSAFVASVIATLIASPVIDGVVRILAKRNKGIFGKCLCTPRPGVVNLEANFAHRTRIPSPSHASLPPHNRPWLLRLGL
jgi:hypothetical protein